MTNHPDQLTARPAKLPPGTELPSDPTDIFHEIIRGNDQLCQHCFRRLRYAAPLNRNHGLDYGDIVAYIEYVVSDDAEYSILDREYTVINTEPDRLESAAPPSDEPSAGETTACKTCGAVDWRRSPPPRSQGEIMSHAAVLSATLREYGIEHDPVTLIETARELKTVPEFAGDDDMIFSEAVAKAIQDGGL